MLLKFSKNRFDYHGIQKFSESTRYPLTRQFETKLFLIQNWQNYYLVFQMKKLEKRKKLLKAKTKVDNLIIESTEQAKDYDPQVYHNFLDFMNRNRLQKLKQRFSEFYGRNFPIDYQQKYNFRERWEDMTRKEQKRSAEEMEQNVFIQLGYSTLLLINVFVVWVLTVQRIFLTAQKQDELHSSAYSLGIMRCLVSGGVNLYLKHKQSQNGLTLTKLLKTGLLDMFALLYFTVFYPITSLNFVLKVLMETLVLLYLYYQAKKIYKKQGFIHVSFRFQEKFKIVDSMINLIIIAHFCSLALYGATWGQNESSWIIIVGIEDADYLIKYLYSFYFCSTTILTVGYGDISPKNPREVMIVTIIQFFGVITFGYLINQIGHALSIMRKQEEGIEKDLKTLGRIQKFYKIDRSLINETKGYLINHQNGNDQLIPEEENNLLGKLNEQLRGEISFERSLSAIKSSIFFLCRWSKGMQTEMALKLQNLLFAPNQRLPQPTGNERIYIIKKGKVDIFIKRFGPNHRDDSYFLKRMQIDGSKQISDNVYGYTAMISNKPCHLDAVASDFTSCLFIPKEDFEICVNKNNLDREYYHEIKTNIDSSQFCQAHQAPSILNTKQHYYPTRTVLIRKLKIKEARAFNQRKSYLRNSHRLKKHSFENILKIIEDINDKLLSTEDCIDQFTDRTSTPVYPASFRETLKDDITERLKKSTIMNPIRERLRSKIGSIYRGTTEVINEIEKGDQELALKRKFQKAFEYENYFSHGNLEKVLAKLSRENYMQSQRRISRQSSLQKSEIAV